MWTYKGIKGNLFIALHIVSAMITSGIARAVFIKTAKAQGIFADVKEEDSDEEDEKDDKKTK